MRISQSESPKNALIDRLLHVSRIGDVISFQWEEIQSSHPTGVVRLVTCRRGHL